MTKLTAIVMVVVTMLLGYAVVSTINDFETYLIGKVKPVVVPKQEMIGPPVPLFRWTEKEVRCMAENIYHEARGEPLLGQLGVAQVTINRWLLKQNQSLCNVIYARNEYGCQFSWVCERKSKPKGPAWDEAQRVAEMVLYGDVRCDVIREAVYFHASYVSPKWAKHKKRLASIGNHVFYGEHS